MKLRLEDALPEVKLHNVVSPFVLFSLMDEAKLLSSDNLSHLSAMLSCAGQQDLREQLEGELKINQSAFHRERLVIGNKVP